MVPSRPLDHLHGRVSPDPLTPIADQSRLTTCSGVAFLIVLFTLLECDIASVTVYQLVGLVPSWLIPVAHFLLIAVIMIPICKRLVQGNRNIAKMVTTVHTGYIVLLGIVLLCYLAIYTHLVDAAYRTGTRADVSGLRLHQRRLATAYYVLAVIGMLMAAANMLFALARGHHLRRGVRYFAQYTFIHRYLTWICYRSYSPPPWFSSYHHWD